MISYCNYSILWRNCNVNECEAINSHTPFQIQRLVAITDVSGSGKSILARDVLLANAQTAFAVNYSTNGIHPRQF